MPPILRVLRVKPSFFLICAETQSLGEIAMSEAFGRGDPACFSGELALGPKLRFEPIAL
jgi:hypothetical protein